MPTVKKEKQVEDLKGRFSRAASVVQAEYRGITAVSMEKLRSTLRKDSVELKVVKNRLAKRAAKGTDVEKLSGLFSGPISLAISYDSSTAPSRILSEFAKEDKNLVIIGGMAEGDTYDASRIKEIGNLPDMDTQRAVLLSAMQGTPRNFVSVLSGVTRKFLYLLKAIEEEKEKKPESIGGKEMANISAEDVKEYLNNLSVLKLSELTKDLEDTWGVSAAAPVAVAAGGPAAGADAVAEEKTEFDVILTAIGDKKIQVIKAVREITGLGLKEAKGVVDEAPKAVKEKIGKEDAEALKKKLEEAGATVEIK